MTGTTRKKSLGRSRRALRAVASLLDPRAYLHILKIINYYNYTHVAELRKMKRGRGVRISPTASFANGQNIVLGDGVSIGAYNSLWAGPGQGRIVVGNDALFGPSIMVTAANYSYNEGSPVTKQSMKEQDVKIGRDVWIGHGAIVLPGATVGDGAVVAAGTVVRGQVESHAIVAGNPMRVIGKRDRVQCLGGHTGA